MSEFAPAWWIRGPHAQTVWGRLTRPRTAITMRREILRTPDDDDLIVDHLDGSRLRFVLLHGLEGSSNSVYMQGLLHVIARHGFAATAMNFRSCARDPRNLSRMLMNRTPWLYHSGDTRDFDFLVRSLPSDLPIVAIGASLGGNAILKWLGEHPEQDIVKAAATMSVPYDLAAGAHVLSIGAGRFYTASILQDDAAEDGLGRGALRSEARCAGRNARPDVSRLRQRFDRAAAWIPRRGRLLHARQLASLSAAITTPALCISAEDDPFLPLEALGRAQAAASPSIEFRITRSGGHTGFIAGTVPWRAQYWAEELTVGWVAERARAQ